MVTNLTLLTVNREVHCVVAVVCFTKWVEVCLLNSKDAAMLANWFYLHLVAHFSKPKWVRVNQGQEFMGSFA